MADTMRLPKSGEGWRHYRTGYPSLYDIVGTGHDAKTGRAVVIYRLWPDGEELWSLQLDRFLGVTKDHKQRFTFEREAPDSPDMTTGDAFNVERCLVCGRQRVVPQGVP